MTTATLTSNIAFANAANGVKKFFSSLGKALAFYGESQTRMIQVEKLTSMSDEQLQARGIKREDIVHYVFRDLTGD